MMQPMPKLKRARGAGRGTGIPMDGMNPLPPMPGKRTRDDRPEGDESNYYGGGVTTMRTNLQQEYGFGPMRELEARDEGDRNKPINAGKSSRQHREWAYSNGTANERLAVMLKAERERNR